MVSPKRACIIVVLALIPFIFMYQCDGDNGNITAFDSQKVNISVYYGSLCIPCATFLVKNLQDIFYHEIITIVNLHLVPWANSHVNNNSIICQNGEDECILNSLEECAINIWNVDKYYYLINCFEFLAIEGRPKDWKSCINELGLPSKPIMNCYKNGTTTELAKAYINETEQLSPPPTILPWVLVNNQPVGKEYENIISYVCKAYKGTTVPAACNSLDRK